MNALGNALNKLVKKLQDPFLVVMLAIVIVLAIVSSFRAGWESLIVVGIVAVHLFVAYLLFLNRNAKRSELENERVFRELALRISLAIKDEGYVPGNSRQQDLGAALAAKVASGTSSLARCGGTAMADEFKRAFDVPDSLFGEGS